MKERFDLAVTKQDWFMQSRPVLDRHNDPHLLSNWLVDEAQELTVALQNTNEENIRSEFADCFIFVMSIGVKLGMTPTDMLDAVMEKIEINEGRFPRHRFMSGDFGEIYNSIKAKEKPATSCPKV